MQRVGVPVSTTNNTVVAIRHFLGSQIWLGQTRCSACRLVARYSASSEGFNPWRADSHIGELFIDSIGMMYRGSVEMPKEWTAAYGRLANYWAYYRVHTMHY